MTAKEVAKISGVSVRTLHHYDEIGLLVPKRNHENDYRDYSKNDLNSLQQILFFKECGFSLSRTKEFMLSPNFRKEEAFLIQRQLLEKEKSRIDRMIKTIDLSLAEMKGAYKMSNNEKFEVFKEKLIKENENKFGDEIRQKYGKETLESSNSYFRKMSEQDFKKLEELAAEIADLLERGEASKELAEAHKEWLILSWGDSVPYSKEVHLNLCDMYLADDRFMSHYGGKSKTLILRESIEKYL